MSVVRRSCHRSRIDVGIRGRLALGVAACALVAALLSACEEKQPGRALAPGLGRDVVAAPDGRAVAFFGDQ